MKLTDDNSGFVDSLKHRATAAAWKVANPDHYKRITKFYNDRARKGSWPDGFDAVYIAYSEFLFSVQLLSGAKMGASKNDPLDRIENYNRSFDPITNPYYVARSYAVPTGEHIPIETLVRRRCAAMGVLVRKTEKGLSDWTTLTVPELAVIMENEIIQAGHKLLPIHFVNMELQT